MNISFHVRSMSELADPNSSRSYHSLEASFDGILSAGLCHMSSYELRALLMKIDFFFYKQGKVVS